MSVLMDGSMVNQMSLLPEVDTSIPPAYRQDIYTTADPNGNSRACRIIYGRDGEVLDVIRRDYSWPSWTYELPAMLKIHVRAGEWRAICKMETARWRT